MPLTAHKISCEIKIDALKNLEDPFLYFILFTFFLSELPDINIWMQLLFITGQCTVLYSSWFMGAFDWDILAQCLLGKKNGIVLNKKTTEYIAWSSINVGTMQPGIRECANFTLPTSINWK